MTLAISQEPVHVVGFRFRLRDAVDDLHEPGSAEPAGHTMAARLVLEEMEDAFQHLDHGRVLIHDKDGAAPQCCRIFLQIDEVHLHVEHVGAEKSACRSADERPLNCLPSLMPPPYS